MLKTKNLFRILLTLCLTMVFALIPMFSTSASAATDFSTGWTKITVNTTIDSDGKYYLDSDVTGNITINSGVTVTLDLNGHILKSGGEGSIIENNGTLTIQDSNADAVHYFTYSADSAWVLDTVPPAASDTVEIIDLADFTLDKVSDTTKTYHIKVYGGCITGSVIGKNYSQLFNGQECVNYYLGAGIYNTGALTVNGGNIVGNTNVGRGAGIGNNGGSLTINGGCICGNFLSADSQQNVCAGAGINFFQGDSFEINGCNIIGNTASGETGSGGGIYVAGSNNVFNDGKISYNTAKEGAGVSISANGTFEMDGGRIFGNQASSSGGGVFVGSNSSFAMAAGSVSDNHGEDGGGFAMNGSSSLTVTGGSVLNNIADKRGGGIYNPGGLLTLGGKSGSGTFIGGIISGNTAEQGGGVYNASDLSLIGKTVISGNSADEGGGIYYNDGIFSVDNSPCVKDNTVTETSVANNVYISSECTQLISVETAPTDSMCIGVTLGNGKGNAAYSYYSNTNAKYFFSDNSAYGVHDSGKADVSKSECSYVYIGNPVAKDESSLIVYETVQEAVNAIENTEQYYDEESEKYVTPDKEGSILMLGDSEENVTIGADTVLTLNMDGKTLTGTGEGSVITNSGDLTLTGGTIAGGNAVNGGAVNNNDSLVATGVTFTGNTASGDGGAIYDGMDAQLLLNGCTLNNNTATGNGGAICNAGGQAKVKDTTDKCVLLNTVIKDNAATQGGGVYYKKTTPCDSKEITVTFNLQTTRVTLDSNTKTVSTGGAYGNLPVPSPTYYQVKPCYYIFSGWYDAITGGNKITSKTIVEAESDITLYAQWTKSMQKPSEDTTDDDEDEEEETIFTNYTAGVLTLGSGTKITGNTTGNVYLADNSSLIKLYDEFSDASVGVTISVNPTEEVPIPFTTNGTTDDVKYFFSDNASYGVKYNSDHLELVTASTDVTGAGYYASLTLNDNIDVNFKMKNLGDFFSADKLKVYADGTEITTVYDSGNITGVLKAVAPKNMGDDIHVVVAYDGVIVKIFDYSVQAYCKTVLADTNHKTYSSNLWNLCEATLNYGKWAEDYFNEKDNTGAAASSVNSGYEIDFTDTVINAPEKEVINTGNEFSDATASLTLGSNISLNFKFTSSRKLDEDDITISNVSSGNIQFERTQPNTEIPSYSYTVSITGIGASMLSGTYTLTVNDVSSDVFSITYSVYTYCDEVQSQQGVDFTAKLKTLCKAIYTYGEAAKTYSENPNE